MGKLKWGAALLALPLMAWAGLYVAGWLVLLLLRLDTALLETTTWLQYAQALGLPQLQPHATRVRLAGAIGLLVAVCGCACLWWLLLRPRMRALHGNARFANPVDLARSGLLGTGDDGIIVGSAMGRLLRLRGQQFAILAAPTRSGKGVGVVVPNLLHYRESMVVLDIKQENYELTSGWRAGQGHDVYLFNPFAHDRRTHRWNPLHYVSADPAFRVSDLMAIAAMLYPDAGPEQTFWVSQARNAFLAFALYLFENQDDAHASGFPALPPAPTLGAVYRLSSGDGTPLRGYLDGLSKRPFLAANARMAFANLLSQAEDTFASILGTFREPLNAWVNPVLDAATSGDDFLLTDLRRRRMTVYVGIQPDKLAESRVIVNLFFSQVVNQNTRVLPRNDPGLKHQCLLLMDEFTSIGKVDIIASAVAYMAGYNLRLLPIIQSMAQLDATYGKDVARTLLTNHALQIIYAPREQQDANDYSEMLGYTTRRATQVTRGRGREVSRSQSQERRALMLPQELKALGGTRQVVLYEGMPNPVLCDKIRYYRDAYFRRRLLPAVVVPTLAGPATTAEG